MRPTRSDRRRFLKTASVTAASAAFIPSFAAPQSQAWGTPFTKQERPVLGCIGTGSRWNAVGPNAMAFADCVAVCDADANHRAAARKRVQDIQGRDVEEFEDYRRILDNPDIDVVTIVTPDHWHTKIAIEAMQAGKDVYCEKPLTLTIDEGKMIRKVLHETGRVFQVGTQQRSEMDLRFLRAVALIQQGRLGEIQRATCAIGGAPTCDPLPIAEVPNGLNWDLWLGQAPKVDYRRSEDGRNSRCHYEFRWWYEYSGGKMTDWGAHHIDIAQWAMGLSDTGPVSVAGTAQHPVPFENGYPTVDDRYNTATQFNILCKFANGMEIVIRDEANDLGFDNGILIEGTEGRILVNRGKLVGKPVEDLEDNPLPEDALVQAYKGKEPGGPNAHMRNFFECVASREQPISDVDSHHRAMTTCHLANIAIRLGRPLQWDPEAEQIVGDDDARSWQSREQRAGYEIKV